MSLWIPVTIFAAFMQNLRFMLQKHLKATRLSTAGATFSRFVFAAPLAIVAAALLLGWNGAEFPVLSPRFLTFAIAGALAQILATLCVVALFAARNFTVGITFKKTEVVQTALVAWLVLGEGIAIWGLVAILVGFAGVILLADPPAGVVPLGWRQRVFNRASGFGLLSGALFGISAIGYRGAALALPDGDAFLRAGVTLAFVTVFQTIVMSLWLAWREKGEIARVLGAWRVTGLVGVTGMLGSYGWFAAFAMQHAAYVKALGQIELVFTFLASHFVFRERGSARETGGILLVVASILLLILALRP